MIAESLRKIREELPESCTLVAVSKTHPASVVLEAYQAGQRHFGENKVQEMCDKFELLPKDIHWHLIGHLQTNKVKYIAPFVHLIHAVDSDKLLEEIDKRAAQNERKIAVLLQMKIAEEETKFGATASEIEEMASAIEGGKYPDIVWKGLMGMASFTDDESQVSREFKSLKNLFEQLKIRYPEIDTLSMGMSGDYPLAIAEGSNMVRVGSAIFGARG
jgi:pyridoxal phosphate enzyme (YggS family)